jgi:hypothetical protein
MLSTDAYAFLDIDKPLCAWATYRGTLVCAPNEPGFVSVWTTGLLEDGRPGRIAFESALELVRAREFPNRVSRLRGLFCLPDLDSAKRASSWDDSGRTHFQPDYLAELSLARAGPARDRMDSNWITNAPLDANGFLTVFDWIPQYWAGVPYPGTEPIWETLVDGRIIVLGTELREKAYRAVRSEFPDSLMLLEISRQAAWIDSDLGVITGYLRRKDGEIFLEYLMDMRDAENPEFLSRLKALGESGHPVNWDDMKRHVENSSFGAVPDLRPYAFCRPIPDARSPLIVE